MHPVINTLMAEIRQKEVRRHAAESRTDATVRADKPGIQERLALRIGTLLIAAGQRIRAPYEPVLNHPPTAYGPGC